MTEEQRSYAVDRVEADRAILIGDHDGRALEVPLASLPFRIREAMVLTVPVDARSRPDWTRTARDEVEERRRLEEGKTRLERLKHSDPGGDIKL